MTDGEFLAALESCTLPESEFGHVGHVRAGWLYLRANDFAGALSQMSTALRRYAAAHGKPDRYHETITVAYLALINEHRYRYGDGGDWPAFIGQNEALLDRRLLCHYYRPETLASPEARRVFILGEFRNPPHGS
jgi:hypothetical protein